MLLDSMGLLTRAIVDAILVVYLVVVVTVDSRIRPCVDVFHGIYGWRQSLNQQSTASGFATLCCKNCGITGDNF